MLGGFLVGGILLGGRFGAAITIIQVILILNYVVIVREFFRSTVKALLLQHEKTALADKLEQARAELQREARAKSAFLANISHEVRTPLNGIIGTNALLGMTDLDERQRRYNETVRHSAENLLAILNDMLDFSKLEAGRFQLDRTAFDPEQLVEDAVELVAPRVQAKGLELVVRVDLPVRRTLIGDPVRIRQILLNLLSNAVKFTERGLVAVSLTGAPGEGDFKPALRLEVRDTGPGIDPEARARLFHSFEQADGSITRRYGGTGLGLAICKELVQLMDGRIEVESEKGAGSTFRVELALPLAEAGTRRPEPQGLSGLGALLVAPPGPVRDQHERLLAEAGIAVATADTLELTDDLPAGLDVVLVDGRIRPPAGSAAHRSRRPSIRLDPMHPDRRAGSGCAAGGRCRRVPGDRPQAGPAPRVVARAGDLGPPGMASMARRTAARCRRKMANGEILGRRRPSGQPRDGVVPAGRGRLSGRHGGERAGGGAPGRIDRLRSGPDGYPDAAAGRHPGDRGDPAHGRRRGRISGHRADLERAGR